jgi:hypothetical protein
MDAGVYPAVEFSVSGACAAAQTPTANGGKDAAVCRTRVNNGEPLFGQHRAKEKALAVFYRVFRLSRVKYAFYFQ